MRPFGAHRAAPRTGGGAALRATRARPPSAAGQFAGFAEHAGVGLHGHPDVAAAQGARTHSAKRRGAMFGLGAGGDRARGGRRRRRTTRWQRRRRSRRRARRCRASAPVRPCARRALRALRWLPEGAGSAEGRHGFGVHERRDGGASCTSSRIDVAPASRARVALACRGFGVAPHVVVVARQRAGRGATTGRRRGVRRRRGWSRQRSAHRPL